MKKEVRFDKWCPICKNRYNSDDMEPCNICLDTAARTNSTKPVQFALAAETKPDWYPEEKNKKE